MIKKILKLYIMSLLLCGITVMGFAREWGVTSGGNGTDYLIDSVRLADGNYLFCGASNSTDLPGLTNNGGYDGYLEIVNPDGNLISNMLIGSTGNEYLVHIEIMSDGSYLLFGTNQSVFGNVVGDSVMYVLKMNPQGVIVWENQYNQIGAPGKIIAVSDGYLIGGDGLIKLDKNGAFVSHVNPGYNFTEFAPTSDNGYVVFIRNFLKTAVVKLDTNFNVEWEKSGIHGSRVVEKAGIITVCEGKTEIDHPDYPFPQIGYSSVEVILHQYSLTGTQIAQKSIYHYVKYGTTINPHPAPFYYYGDMTVNSDNEICVAFYYDVSNTFEYHSYGNTYVVDQNLNILYKNGYNISPFTVNDTSDGYIITGYHTKNTSSDVSFAKMKINKYLDNEPIGNFTNEALNKPIFASSEYNTTYVKENANDGNAQTVWGSGTTSNNEWIYIDLEQQVDVEWCKLQWYGSYYARQYSQGYSDDGVNWTFLANDIAGDGNVDILFNKVSARYIGILLTQKNNIAYGLAEFEVFKKAPPVPTPTPTLTPIPTATLPEKQL